MKGSSAMKTIINVLSRSIPLLFLLLIWIDMEGVTQYTGYIIYSYDRLTYTLGLVILFIPVLIKTNSLIKSSIGLAGNFLFWGRLLYKASTKMNPKYLTAGFYATVLVVAISIGIQVYLIYKEGMLNNYNNEKV